MCFFKIEISSSVTKKKLPTFGCLEYSKVANKISWTDISAATSVMLAFGASSSYWWMSLSDGFDFNGSSSDTLSSSCVEPEAHTSPSKPSSSDSEAHNNDVQHSFFYRSKNTYKRTTTTVKSVPMSLFCSLSSEFETPSKPLSQFTHPVASTSSVPLAGSSCDRSTSMSLCVEEAT